MKHLLRILMIMLLVIPMLRGQEFFMEDSVPPVNERYEWLFQHVDLSQVPTGLLYEYGLNLIEPGDFKGDGTGDTCNFDKYTRMYATLYGSTVDSNLLMPDPAGLYMNAYYGFTKGDAIPLLGMVAPYNYFHPGSVDSGWISISGEQFYDVLPRSSSPYLTDTVFMFAPLFPLAEQGEVKFLFDTNHIWRHPDISVSTWSADFGQGFVTLTHGQEYVLPLLSGDYLFDFRAGLTGGRVLECRAHFGVRPVYLASYPSSPDINFTVTGAKVNGFSSCGDGTVRKPLIWIEGFNPQLGPNLQKLTDNNGIGLFSDYTWVQFYDNLLYSYNGTPIRSLLESNDYDLFYIDFDDGAGDMYANAAAVREAIVAINVLKAQSGSDLKNMVIGESMGGVLGKIALREMELDNEDHETEKLISFDSPFQGANIPVAFQDILLYLSDYRIYLLKLSNFIPALKDAKDLLYKPASKQMLIYSLDPIAMNEGVTFKNYVKNLGQLEKAEHIAVANGAIDGTPVFSPGAPFISVYATASNLAFETNAIKEFLNVVLKVLGLLTGKYTEIGIELRALPSQSSSWQTIVRFDVRTNILGLIPVVSKHKLKVKDVFPVDGLPGGVVGAKLESNISNLGGVLMNPFQFTFVPVYSALNLETPYNSQIGIDLSDIDLTLNTGKTLVTKYDGSVTNWPVHSGSTSQKNQYHAVFYSNNVEVILNELGVSTLTYNVPEGNWWGVYNFGENTLAVQNNELNGRTPNVLKSSLTIEQNGKLYVGRNDRIANMISLRPVHDSGDYHVRVTTGCDNLTLVTIDDGGLLEVGDSDDADYNANMNFESNTGMVVDDGGICLINRSSKIVLQNNSFLDIKEGGFIEAVHGGGIVIEEGGELVVREGATLRLSHANSFAEVKEGGKMVIERGAVIQLWDGTHTEGAARILVKGELEMGGEISFTGNGYFDFYKTMTLTLADGQLEIEGYNKQTRLMRLNGQTKVDIGTNHLNIKNGRIDYDYSSWITTGYDSRINLESVHLNAIGSDCYGLKAEEYNRVTIVNTDVTGFEIGVSLLGPGTWTLLPARIIGCTFEDNEISVALEQLDEAYISGSTFTGTGVGDAGVFVATVNQLMVVDSEFTGYERALFFVGNKNNVSVSGSRIEDNVYGITTFDSGDELNVVIRKGTVIGNNHVGIQIHEGKINETGPDFGLVLFDCGKLVNNKTGIFGKDILLQIDAYTNSSPNPLVTRRNSFICQLPEGQFLFDICYEARAVSVNSILARGNYWNFGTVLPVGSPWYIRQQNSISGPFCSNAPNIVSPFDRTGEVSTEPMECPETIIIEHRSGEEIDCLYETGSYSMDILEKYKEFYSSWATSIDEDEYDPRGDWYYLLEELMTIDPSSEELDSVCAHLVRVSHNFRKEIDLSRQGSVITSKPGDKNTLPVLFYPNPVDGELYFELSAGDWEVIIVHISGLEVMRFSVSGGDGRKDCSMLSPGVYIVKAIESGKDETIQKFIKR